MHVLRKPFLWIAVLLLNLIVVLTLVVLPVSTHLTSRDSVKSWVSSPEVLEGSREMVPDLLSKAIKGDDTTAGLEQISEDVIGVDTSKLIESSSDVFTPEYVEEKITPVVDGVYDWLEGKTERPEFNVLLSDRLTALTETVENPLKTELMLLPECPPSMVYTTDYNPIEALCVPPGADINMIVNEFSRQVTANEDMVDINMSSDNLDLDQNILETGPRVYSVFGALPFIMAGILTMLSIAIVFLAKTRRKGVHKVAWTFMGNGLITALSFWLISISDVFFRLNASETEGDLMAEKIVTPLIKVIIGDIARTGIALSLAVAAIGAVLWLSSFTHHKITHEQVPAKAQ